jgi:hypothetical protein
MASTSAATVVPQVKSLICPNCGGQVQLRGYAQTVNAVCINCNTILDTRTPTLAVIQTFQTRERIQPLIPLGSRGQLHNILFEVIGFQARQIESDGVPYQWREYLLYNPYEGYRYLTEYDGHWNDGKTVQALPEFTNRGRKEAARLNGITFTHFQTASAQTVYVMGEFPWQVRVGETVTVKDYIAAPALLSAEITDAEVTWSAAEYTSGAALWQAFKLPGRPPATSGIFENQPSPYTNKIASVWKTFAFLTAALVVIAIALGLSRSNETVFTQDYTFQSRATEPSFVTPVFELKGRPTTVEIDISTNLLNDWAYFSLALINEQTGTAYDVGKEISYYTSSDGNEGSTKGDVTIPTVPAGRYYLRVEPEMTENSSAALSGRRMDYTITVKRDAGSGLPFLFAFFLLLIPPIVTTVRAIKFENRRWAESDYGPMFQTSGNSGGGSDD